MRARLTFVTLLLVCTICATQTQGPSAQTQLLTRPVTLYKSGVWYFEHVGSITGSPDVIIPFTTAQLNDALRSMTVLDLDGGSIANITYDSIAPVAQRLSTLSLPLSGDTSQLQFFQALRGARMEIKNAATITTGRFLAVEPHPQAHSGVSEVTTELTIVTDDGEARTIELTPAMTVRVLDREVRDDIGRYMSIVASARPRYSRRSNSKMG